MRFERLTDCHDPRYEAARTLYRRSFPRHEHLSTQILIQYLGTSFLHILVLNSAEMEI